MSLYPMLLHDIVTNYENLLNKRNNSKDQLNTTVHKLNKYISCLAMTFTIIQLLKNPYLLRCVHIH
uniref:Uncharacterized protein n=1 Tax=Heterorhabditis bacteriophora TaxID=37862 RepID=A0A1I7W994_HETBA